MTFSEIEKEVIFLKAIQELIDSMVNYEVLDLVGNDPDSEIRFRSITHQRYFNIILVDFLSCSDEKVIGERRSYLDAILTICEKPNFNKNGSINNLSSAAKEFIGWLEQEAQADVWLPSTETEAFLSIKRIELLRICGNISKHNFARLSVVVSKLVNIFNRNNIDINFESALLILDDFYERFHSDILNYHGSTIAEFLNNIRWGIYDYLQPEYCHSIVREGGDPLRYRYTFPDGVVSKFAKNCYWELMNEVRSKPYMRKFKATRLLKLRY